MPRKHLETFWRLLKELKLDEDVLDSPSTTRTTVLGKELQVEAFMAFVGAFNIWEIPTILEDAGYITEAEANAIFEVKAKRPNRVMRRLVLKAYLKFCNHSKYLN